MAKFIFDCEDEICLPAAYHLVEDANEFVKKMKTIDADGINEDAAKDKKEKRIAMMKHIVKNMMVKYPEDTSRIMSKLWILDGDEKAPNVFATLGTFFANETAVNFFTCVMPSLLGLSSQLLRGQTREN